MAIPDELRRAALCPPRVFRRFRGPTASGILYCADSLDFLLAIKSNSVALVFLDPPFNLGKDYGTGRKDDRVPPEEYESWLRAVLEEAIRILAPGGSLFFYHKPDWALRLGYGLQEKLFFRHWIAVSMKCGFVRGNKLYPAHYALLYFTKGQPANFSRPKIPLQRCRHCGKTVKDYGGYLSIVDSKGLNVSDVWDDLAISDVWLDLSPVRHPSRKSRPANELPLALTERILAISGREGELFVDPFAGSGAGVVAAVKAGMRFQAADILEDNCRTISQRLAGLTKRKEKP